MAIFIGGTTGTNPQKQKIVWARGISFILVPLFLLLSFTLLLFPEFSERESILPQKLGKQNYAVQGPVSLPWAQGPTAAASAALSPQVAGDDQPGSSTSNYFSYMGPSVSTYATIRANSVEGGTAETLPSQWPVILPFVAAYEDPVAEPAGDTGDREGRKSRPSPKPVTGDSLSLAAPATQKDSWKWSGGLGLATEKTSLESALPSSRPPSGRQSLSAVTETLSTEPSLPPDISAPEPLDENPPVAAELSLSPHAAIPRQDGVPLSFLQAARSAILELLARVFAELRIDMLELALHAAIPQQDGVSRPLQALVSASLEQVAHTTVTLSIDAAGPEGLLGSLSLAIPAGSTGDSAVFTAPRAGEWSFTVAAAEPPGVVQTGAVADIQIDAVELALHAAIPQQDGVSQPLQALVSASLEQAAHTTVTLSVDAVGREGLQRSLSLVIPAGNTSGSVIFTAPHAGEWSFTVAAAEPPGVVQTGALAGIRIDAVETAPPPDDVLPPGVVTGTPPTEPSLPGISVPERPDENPPVVTELSLSLHAAIPRQQDGVPRPLQALVSASLEQAAHTTVTLSVDAAGPEGLLGSLSLAIPAGSTGDSAVFTAPRAGEWSFTVAAAEPPGVVQTGAFAEIRIDVLGLKLYAAIPSQDGVPLPLGSLLLAVLQQAVPTTITLSIDAVGLEGLHRTLSLVIPAGSTSGSVIFTAPRAGEWSFTVAAAEPPGVVQTGAFFGIRIDAVETAPPPDDVLPPEVVTETPPTEPSLPDISVPERPDKNPPVVTELSLSLHAAIPRQQDGVPRPLQALVSASIKQAVPATVTLGIDAVGPEELRGSLSLAIPAGSTSGSAVFTAPRAGEWSFTAAAAEPPGLLLTGAVAKIRIDAVVLALRMAGEATPDLSDFANRTVLEYADVNSVLPNYPWPPSPTVRRLGRQHLQILAKSGPMPVPMTLTVTVTPPPESGKASFQKVMRLKEGQVEVQEKVILVPAGEWRFAISDVQPPGIMAVPAALPVTIAPIPMTADLYLCPCWWPWPPHTWSSNTWAPNKYQVRFMVGDYAYGHLDYGYRVLDTNYRDSRLISHRRSDPLVSRLGSYVWSYDRSVYETVHPEILLTVTPPPGKGGKPYQRKLKLKLPTPAVRKEWWTHDRFHDYDEHRNSIREGDPTFNLGDIPGKWTIEVTGTSPTGILSRIIGRRMNVLVGPSLAVSFHAVRPERAGAPEEGAPMRLKVTLGRALDTTLTLRIAGGNRVPYNSDLARFPPGITSFVFNSGAFGRLTPGIWIFRVLDTEPLGLVQRGHHYPGGDHGRVVVKPQKGKEGVSAISLEARTPFVYCRHCRYSVPQPLQALVRASMKQAMPATLTLSLDAAGPGGLHRSLSLEFPSGSANRRATFIAPRAGWWIFTVAAATPPGLVQTGATVGIQIHKAWLTMHAAISRRDGMPPQVLVSAKPWQQEGPVGPSMPMTMPATVTLSVDVVGPEGLRRTLSLTIPAGSTSGSAIFIAPRAGKWRFTAITAEPPAVWSGAFAEIRIDAVETTPPPDDMLLPGVVTQTPPKEPLLPPDISVPEAPDENPPVVTELSLSLHAAIPRQDGVPRPLQALVSASLEQAAHTTVTLSVDAAGPEGLRRSLSLAIPAGSTGGSVIFIAPRAGEWSFTAAAAEPPDLVQTGAVADIRIEAAELALHAAIPSQDGVPLFLQVLVSASLEQAAHTTVTLSVDAARPEGLRRTLSLAIPAGSTSGSSVFIAPRAGEWSFTVTAAEPLDLVQTGAVADIRIEAAELALHAAIPSQDGVPLFLQVLVSASLEQAAHTTVTLSVDAAGPEGLHRSLSLAIPAGSTSGSAIFIAPRGGIWSFRVVAAEPPGLVQTGAVADIRIDAAELALQMAGETDSSLAYFADKIVLEYADLSSELPNYPWPPSPTVRQLGLQHLQILAKSGPVPVPITLTVTVTPPPESGKEPFQKVMRLKKGQVEVQEKVLLLPAGEWRFAISDVQPPGIMAVPAALPVTIAPIPMTADLYEDPQRRPGHYQVLFMVGLYADGIAGPYRVLDPNYRNFNSIRHEPRGPSVVSGSYVWSFDRSVYETFHPEILLTVTPPPGKGVEPYQRKLKLNLPTPDGYHWCVELTSNPFLIYAGSLPDAPEGWGPYSSVDECLAEYWTDHLYRFVNYHSESIREGEPIFHLDIPGKWTIEVTGTSPTGILSRIIGRRMNVLVGPPLAVSFQAVSPERAGVPGEGAPTHLQVTLGRALDTTLTLRIDRLQGSGYRFAQFPPGVTSVVFNSGTFSRLTPGIYIFRVRDVEPLGLVKRGAEYGARGRVVVRPPNGAPLLRSLQAVAPQPLRARVSANLEWPTNATATLSVAATGPEGLRRTLSLVIPAGSASGDATFNAPVAGKWWFRVVTAQPPGLVHKRATAEAKVSKVKLVLSAVPWQGSIPLSLPAQVRASMRQAVHTTVTLSVSATGPEGLHRSLSLAIPAGSKISSAEFIAPRAGEWRFTVADVQPPGLVQVTGNSRIRNIRVGAAEITLHATIPRQGGVPLPLQALVSASIKQAMPATLTFSVDAAGPEGLHRSLSLAIPAGSRSGSAIFIAPRAGEWRFTVTAAESLGLVRATAGAVATIRPLNALTPPKYLSPFELPPPVRVLVKPPPGSEPGAVDELILPIVQLPRRAVLGEYVPMEIALSDASEQELQLSLEILGPVETTTERRTLSVAAGASTAGTAFGPSTTGTWTIAITAIAPAGIAISGSTAVVLVTDSTGLRTVLRDASRDSLESILRHLEECSEANGGCREEVDVPAIGLGNEGEIQAILRRLRQLVADDALQMRILRELLVLLHAQEDGL